MSTSPLLRIGELSRRVGVPVELLRAWERRYGLLSPSRTKGGFRLYGDEDVRRVQSMRAHLDEGLSAAEAARLALAEAEADAETEAGDGTPLLAAGIQELSETLERFDEAGAQAILDRLLSSLTLDVVLREVLVPYLRELGDKWERGEVSVAQEHFASAVVRGRLMSLARGWDRGAGPRALLACAQGEQHDLPLLAFGLALRTHGWRVSYLGADTPLPSLVEATRALAPEAVVVSGTNKGAFGGLSKGLKEVGGLAQLFVAGAAASEKLAKSVGGAYLDGDLVAAAESLAAGRR